MIFKRITTKNLQQIPLKALSTNVNKSVNNTKKSKGYLVNSK